MSGLELKGVSKSFGSVEVVRHVNLSVDDGEFVVFVGPSGCGKSTLLRMIAGLEKVGAGEVRIGARDVTDLDPSERKVAMVFQSYALYPHMSVEENIGFGLRMNGMSKSDVRGKVMEAASILHLEDLLKRKPRELSGGQRQRVAIGRAIVRKPQVFLFDEPLSNLDAELRVQMRLEITKLHQAMGATMIYVTHDQTEAMTLADKIVVLRSGRVEQVGTPLEVYDNPDNAFVAGFIGSPKMNFLPGVAAEAARDGRFIVGLTDFDNVEVPFALTNAPAGSEFLVGVRPEHFARDGEVRLVVTLDVVEHLGGTSFGYARSDSERPLTIELRDRRGIETSARIELGFDAARALLFDRATGGRLR
jgi:lactose/L-arabinose transport system ATP-binding protein